ncbi:MAG: copper amine oxidase N-terminal domain-containing protein, partial [Clostridiales bacterium]|nr:copper amine oxidase N-terminal domain-containing protein [Clostridiales bacterium]
KGELGDSIEKTTDVMPFIDKKSLTPMLPIRILAEAAHATVVWDDEAKICILITAQGDILKIANNEQANTDFKGDIVRDRLFVTSAVIEEIFATKISWSKNLNEISLTL